VNPLPLVGPLVSTATVGLGFVARITTVPLDVGSRQGSGMSHKKHWAKIFVRAIDSYTPKINGIRPPTRNPSTPMNIPEGTHTDDLQVTDLGRDSLAIIEVEQDLPLQLTVLTLFGREGQYAT